MPRIARVVGVGMPHHITQRGNYQQPVFKDSKDRKQYLSWIREYADKFGLSMLVYLSQSVVSSALTACGAATHFLVAAQPRHVVK